MTRPVGGARIEIEGDVSRLAADVERDISQALRNVRVEGVNFDGVATSAEQASESVEDSFDEAADSVDDSMDQAADSAESAGSRVRRAMSRAAGAAGGALRSFVRTSINGLRTMATAAGVVGAAIAGIALQGGISRNLDIEDAQAKLKGLGNDAKAIEQIMDNALESVRGTAFGLEEASTIAASAVAAGIEPGKELERTLKLVADTATIAGADLNEVGTVFNQIATAGRLTGEDLAQLQERGIPVLSFLAEELGKTTEEVREMVSAGEVSFEDFQKAIEANLSGAALESGQTTRGAFANLRAALSRIGANLTSEVLPQFRDFFLDLTESLGPIEDLAVDAGKAIGAFVEGFRDGGLQGAVASFREEIEDLGPGFSDSLSDIFSGIRTGIENFLIDILKLLASNVGTIINGFLNIFQGVVEALPGIIPQVINGVTQLINAIVEVLVRSAPLIVPAAIQLLLGIIDAITQVLPRIIVATVTVIQTIITSILQRLPLIIEAGLNMILALVDGIIQAIPEILFALTQRIIPAFISAIIESLPLILEAGIKLIIAVVNGIIEALPMLIEAVINLIPQIVNAIIESLPKIVEAGIRILIAVIKGIVQVIPRLVDVIITQVIPALFTALINAIPKMVEAGFKVLGGFVRGLINSFGDEVAKFLNSIPGRIEDFFRDAGNWLFNEGAATIQGFIRGMRSQIQPLLSSVGNIGGFASSAIRGSLGIQSPSTVFAGIGRDTVDGMILGLRQREPELARTVEGLSNDITTSVNQVDPADVFGGPGGTPARAQLGDFNVQVFVGDREIEEITDVRIEENNRNLLRRVPVGGRAR